MEFSCYEVVIIDQIRMLKQSTVVAIVAWQKSVCPKPPLKKSIIEFGLS